MNIKFFQFDKFNKDLSKELYEKGTKLIKKKECYFNIASIYYAFLENNEDFKDIKIVFGGWQITEVEGSPKLFAKHCFFLHKGMIIDPNYFTLTNTTSNKEYISLKEYSGEEYSNNLFDICNNDTSLTDVMDPIFREASSELLQHNILLIG